MGCGWKSRGNDCRSFVPEEDKMVKAKRRTYIRGHSCVPASTCPSVQEQQPRADLREVVDTYAAQPLGCCQSVSLISMEA